MPREQILPKSQTTACISEKIKPKVNPKRPMTLSLKKTEKYKLSLNKANQSLPESPVCEELKILKERCRKNANRFARFAAKRKSCSYFIGLNDNETELENITKSFESLPAMNEYIEHKSVEVPGNDDDGNGSFSDDSLEGDFKNPPRRCVSDYLLYNYPELSENQNYPNYENLRRRILTQSQESILSDVSVESFSKGSAEILDYNFEHERHSSASFFLSRRKMQACRSQESILTDESDYQMFPLRENTDHRSTESVLTDDSDSMVKSAPLEMLFDSHYKRKRQNSETYNGPSSNTTESSARNNAEKSSDLPSQLRAVFRSKSLQDTRLNAVKLVNNYLENEETHRKTSIYYNFNLDDNNSKSDNIDDTCDITSKGKINSATAQGEPKSMLVLNDFVAHKPPKPKRNSARTQSMRNRARPAWNKYNMDTSQSQYSECLKNYSCSDTCDSIELIKTSESCAVQDVQSSSKEVSDVESHKKKNRSEDNLKKFENFVQNSHLLPQSCDIQMEKNKYLSLPMKQVKRNSYFGSESGYESKSSCENQSYRNPESMNHTTDSESQNYEDSLGQESVNEVQQNKHFENQIPTKDTPERYDSLEPNLDPPHNSQVAKIAPTILNQQVEGKHPRIEDKNVDIRISRAIEGTVKLLSKEFENLVRRETYFAQNKDFKQVRRQDSNENFAKLEAERDTKCWMLKREARGQSGEDSDCADVSTMDKSIFESGSSTSASSCTNSPKRLWPPASHCQSHAKWTKKLPTINQVILPSKQHYTGTSEYWKKCRRPSFIFVYNPVILQFLFK
ncbi:uncharacterized protein PF3D7_1120600-like [Neodiprion pinetum]|uniref:uncharacterized protein PF3D7_1120600-like n=1 Tax=Neodiprion pinetum TaxID=441929 RepID=UPI00371EF1CE